MSFRARTLTPLLLLTLAAAGGPGSFAVDPVMVAKIREEGLQHSQVMDLESYMTDVLGARLTASDDMRRAQAWAEKEMATIGLTNVTVEPYTDWGVSWDNEYVSLQIGL